MTQENYIYQRRKESNNNTVVKILEEIESYTEKAIQKLINFHKEHNHCANGEFMQKLTDALESIINEAKADDKPTDSEPAGPYKTTIEVDDPDWQIVKSEKDVEDFANRLYKLVAHGKEINIPYIALRFTTSTHHHS